MLLASTRAAAQPSPWSTTRSRSPSSISGCRWRTSASASFGGIRRSAAPRLWARRSRARDAGTKPRWWRASSRIRTLSGDSVRRRRSSSTAAAGNRWASSTTTTDGGPAAGWSRAASRSTSLTGTQCTSTPAARARSDQLGGGGGLSRSGGRDDGADRRARDGVEEPPQPRSRQVAALGSDADAPLRRPYADLPEPVWARSHALRSLRQRGRPLSGARSTVLLTEYDSPEGAGGRNLRSLRAARGAPRVRPRSARHATASPPGVPAAGGASLASTSLLSTSRADVPGWISSRIRSTTSSSMPADRSRCTTAPAAAPAAAPTAGARTTSPIRPPRIDPLPAAPCPHRAAGAGPSAPRRRASR